MKDLLILWHEARRTMRTLMNFYDEPMEAKAISLGLPAHDWFVIFPAFMFVPDPISAERMRIRIPYNAPALYEGSLLRLQVAGCLVDASEGGYYLNDYGLETFRSIINVAYEQLDQLAPILQEEINELSLLLGRLVQAVLLSPPPPCKWSLFYSRRLDPGPAAAAIIKVDQYLADLSSFRDDAHLASWRMHPIYPHAWDILGVIWGGRATTIETVLETIHDRRWTEEQTIDAIEELIKFGWIEKSQELILTEEGRAVREDAERLTNEYFFKSWMVLTNKELDRMGELFQKVSDKFGSSE